MRLRRFFPLVGVMAALAACATPAQDGPKTASSPVTKSLEVCRGLKISNAPSTDARRRLVGFQPFTRVAGATLARAPVAGCVSSGFGPRRGGAGSFHKGVDLYTGAPAPIHAGGDGVIVDTAAQRGYGNVVIIKHNDRVTTRYAHLSSFAPGMKRGRRVRMGDVIGMTGRTGNATAVHLHYEIRIGGEPKNPLIVGG